MVTPPSTMAIDGSEIVPVGTSAIGLARALLHQAPDVPSLGVANEVHARLRQA